MQSQLDQFQSQITSDVNSLLASFMGQFSAMVGASSISAVPSSISTTNVSLSAPVQVPNSATKVVVTGGPSGHRSQSRPRSCSPGVVPERTCPPTPSVSLVSSGVSGVLSGVVGRSPASSVTHDLVV